MDSGQEYYITPIAISHGLFCAIYLLSRGRLARHEWLGLGWIVLVAFACIRRGIALAPAYAGDPNFAPLLRIFAMPLAYGPFLYLYTRSLLDREGPSPPSVLLHLAPFLAVSLVFQYPPLHAEGYLLDRPSTANFAINIPVSAASVLSVLVYVLLSWQRLRRHARTVPELYSSKSEANTLRWLQIVCALFLAAFLFLAACAAARLALHPRLTNSGIVGYLFLISIFILRQPALPEAAVLDRPRYARSAMPAQAMSELARKLEEYMQQHRPYLEADLKISNLSSALKVSAHQISQTLNVHFGVSFYNYVNQFRIEEAKRRFTDPAFDEFPVYRLALDCGFNSRSSFHNLFQKATGLTPAEYRRERRREETEEIRSSIR